jgi:YD repeat-containing protein
VPLDANGNTISKTDSSGTTNYAWDYDNRLTSATLPGSGGTVSYRYDPFGRRIEKISSSTTSIFAYDNNNLVETVNAGGGVVARYAQGLNFDEPLAMLRGATTDYYRGWFRWKRERI